MQLISNLADRLRRKWGTILFGAAIVFVASQVVSCYQRNNGPEYIITKLIAPTPFHGVTGLALSSTGELYAASPNGGAILKVGASDGRVSSTGVNLRDGANGLAIRADGAMAWTNSNKGLVYLRDSAGATRVMAKGLPGVLSVAFAPDGGIFASQVGDNDALWRIDPLGVTPPVKISESLGGLRGFVFGPDGMIYGALIGQKVLAVINPKSGEVVQTVSGYEKPVAVARAPDGVYYALDGAEGTIDQVDFQKGTAMRVTWLNGGIDNMVIDGQGKAYLSLPADDSIIRLDLATRKATKISEGKLGAPSDIAIMNSSDGATLAVADQFALRMVDLNSGQNTDWLRLHSSDLRGPSGIGVGMRWILLANANAGSVTVVDRVKGQPVAHLGGYSMPLDALETEDGRFAILDSSVGELSLASAPDGAERRTIVRGLNTPIAMATDGMGGVFVTESGSGKIERISIRTGERIQIAEGLNQPQGIDIAPDGRLIVAEAGENRVIAIDRNTGREEILAENLDLKPTTDPKTPPSLYAGVAVSPEGAVFVTSSKSNVLYKLTPPR